MKLILVLIRWYGIVISPLLGQNCRFFPTCSDYTAQAVEKHGACKGAYLGLKRICRCHPWNPGGFDPVP
jgi:putative membrane protein insertion efficiency factor